jgi:hypothetical protein
MNTDTPRTEAIREDLTGISPEGKIWNLFKQLEDMERELTAAHAEIERIDVLGIHTCHSNCQRWACVLRRERDLLLETLTDVDLCLEDINFPADGFIRSYIKKSLTKITGEIL